MNDHFYAARKSTSAPHTARYVCGSPEDGPHSAFAACLLASDSISLPETYIEQAHHLDIGISRAERKSGTALVCDQTFGCCLDDLLLTCGELSHDRLIRGVLRNSHLTIDT